MKSTRNLIFLLISLSLGITVIIMHRTIGREIFEGGGSWTRSQLIPYLLCWTNALLVLVFALNTFKSKLISALVGLLLMTGIVGVDFYQNKIYQGDFSKNSVEIQSDNSQLKKGVLTAITIPGCPHCHTSVEVLKAMKKRQPELKIQFLVCSADSTSLEEYVQPINGAFDLALFENLDDLNQLGITGFPSFIYTDAQGNKQRWSNDNFGAPARDFIEKTVKK